MGRPKKYLTEEERMIANAEKSRRCYRKLHPEVQRKRLPIRYFKSDSESEEQK